MMTFNKLPAWQSSLDRRFHRLPIVIATALVCTSLQANPTIDFNGSNQWKDYLDDGTHLEHISVNDESSEINKKNWTIKVGEDGKGTLFFGPVNNNKPLEVNGSLIQAYGTNDELGISIDGNLTIENAHSNGIYSGFILGRYNKEPNYGSHYWYAGKGYFNITGDLSIKNSTSDEYGIYLYSPNEYTNKDSSINFGNIHIEDTKVREKLFCIYDTPSFSSKNITIKGQPTNLENNKSFTTSASVLLDVRADGDINTGDINIDNVYVKDNTGSEIGDIILLTSSNGKIKTGYINVSNSVGSGDVVILAGKSVKASDINVKTINLIDRRARHIVGISGEYFDVGEINVDNISFIQDSRHDYDPKSIVHIEQRKSNHNYKSIISSINASNINFEDSQDDHHFCAIKINNSNNLHINSISTSSIKNFHVYDDFSNDLETTGLLLTDSQVTINNAMINDISSHNTSFGIIEINKDKNNSSKHLKSNNLTIKNINGKFLSVGYFSPINLTPNQNQSQIEFLTIENISHQLADNTQNSKAQCFGIYLSNKELSISNLSTTGIVGNSYTADIVATNSSEVSIANAIINSQNLPAININKEKTVKGVAIYADNSTVSINKGYVSGDAIINNSSTLNLGSDIFTDKKTTENINIGNYLSNIYVTNNAKANIALGKKSYLEGVIDDYWNDHSSRDYHLYSPGQFYEDSEKLEPEKITISSSGTANLTLNGGTWHATGESFVTNLTFGDQAGTLDLRSKGHYDVLVKNLKGNGQVHMLFGTNEQDAGGLIHTDMLYVQNLDENAKLTIYAHPDDSVTSLEDLNGLHFATTNKTNGGQFNVVLQDQGFLDLNLPVTSESYDPNSAINEAYNGHGNGDSEKPGDAVIDDIFQNGGTNWVIQTDGLTPTPKPDPKPEPQPQPDPQPQPQPQPELSTVGSTLLATARSNYWTAVEMDRLNKRLGDARYANGDDGVWLRMRYESNGTNSGYGDFESDAVTYQLGFDHAFKRNNGRWIVGGAVDYKDADVDYKSITGEGSTDRLGLKVYGTWLGDNGAYVDVNAIWGNLSNKFDIVNGLGEKIKADYDNHIMGVSAETGHRFTLANGFFAEPQMQLQYLRVTDANYSTSQGTRMVHEDFDSVISRVGLRSGMSFGQAKEHTVYAKADWMHEWAGDQKIKVYDVTTSRSGFDASIDNKGSWYDVGFGAQAKLSDASYGFVDMEYRFGNSLDKSWVVNAGVRYAF